MEIDKGLKLRLFYGGILCIIFGLILLFVLRNPVGFVVIIGAAIYMIIGKFAKTKKKD